MSWSRFGMEAPAEPERPSTTPCVWENPSWSSALVRWVLSADRVGIILLVSANLIYPLRGNFFYPFAIGWITEKANNIVILKTLCHRKRWPRSSFLSQERPWPQTFCKISSILAKNLYFSAYFPLFLLFSWRRILANRFYFRSIFLNENGKKNGLDEKYPCQKWHHPR